MDNAFKVLRHWPVIPNWPTVGQSHSWIDLEYNGVVVRLMPTIADDVDCFASVRWAYGLRAELPIREPGQRIVQTAECDRPGWTYSCWREAENMMVVERRNNA